MHNLKCFSHHLAGTTQYLSATPLTMDVSELFINSDLEAPPPLASAQPVGKGSRHRIVTLKAMRAEVFLSNALSEIPKPAIPPKLRTPLPPSGSVEFQPVDRHFLVQGVNGCSHLFLTYPLAGPSILAVSDSPGRTANSRRSCTDLARKVAKQTSLGIHRMHCAGVVHGGKLAVFCPVQHVSCR